MGSLLPYRIPPTSSSLFSSKNKAPVFNDTIFFRRYHKGQHKQNKLYLAQLLISMQGHFDDPRTVLSNTIYTQAIGTNSLSEEKAYRLEEYNNLLKQYSEYIDDKYPFRNLDEE